MKSLDPKNKYYDNVFNIDIIYIYNILYNVYAYTDIV